MEKRKLIILCLCTVSIIISAINITNTIKNNKKNGYYIGKIESMNKQEDINVVTISSVKSIRKFTQEITTNHEIHYNDSIPISGVSDRFKDSKKLYLGQLGETIENLQVGDSIIFKAIDYDENSYKINISELVVDVTAD